VFVIVTTSEFSATAAFWPVAQLVAQTAVKPTRDDSAESLATEKRGIAATV
jgi:hypothetical protein